MFSWMRAGGRCEPLVFFLSILWSALAIGARLTRHRGGGGSGRLRPRSAIHSLCRCFEIAAVFLSSDLAFMRLGYVERS